MKAASSRCFMQILALKETSAEWNGRIGLTLVPNEETGGEGGSSWLSREGLLAATVVAMLLAEPTSGVIWNANRGAISLRVQVFGKSAHVGLQHQGANAFERMHRVVARLQTLKHEVEQRTTHAKIGAEQARNSILLLGGQSVAVPISTWFQRSAGFTVDRRINPEEDLRPRSQVAGILEGASATEFL